jgi:Vitamin K-dependent gamma-carboxylase.
MTVESFGAIATGWVRRTLVEPEFTFNFMGFEWLQMLQGEAMYAYFVVMGFASIGMMTGYKYRFMSIAVAILWSGAYYMQKASYNNHYYLWY